MRIDLISRLLSLSRLYSGILHGSGASALESGKSEKEWTLEVRGIGGEIKLFPPPTYHGELDKWDDWSWQLKRYVGLYKPLAKLLMDEVEQAPNKLVTDGLCEAYDVQTDDNTE